MYFSFIIGGSLYGRHVINGTWDCINYGINYKSHLPSISLNSDRYGALDYFSLSAKVLLLDQFCYFATLSV